MLLYGTPGSRLQFRFMHEPAQAAGVHLATPERPGNGRSDPVPGGTSFTGYADELRQLLDHLGRRRSRWAVPVAAAGSRWRLQRPSRSG